MHRLRSKSRLRIKYLCTHIAATYLPVAPVQLAHSGAREDTGSQESALPFSFQRRNKLRPCKGAGIEYFDRVILVFLCHTTRYKYITSHGCSCPIRTWRLHCRQCLRVSTLLFKHSARNNLKLESYLSDMTLHHMASYTFNTNTCHKFNTLIDLTLSRSNRTVNTTDLYSSCWKIPPIMIPRSEMI